MATVQNELSKGLYGYIWWLFIFMFAFLLIIILMVIFGYSTKWRLFSDPLAMLGIALFPIFIVLVLLTLGYYFKWWPYQKIEDTDTENTKNDKNKRNRILFIIFLIISILLFGILILLLFRGLPKKKKVIKNYEMSNFIRRVPLPREEIPIPEIPQHPEPIPKVPEIPQQVQENLKKKYEIPPYLEAEREQEKIYSSYPTKEEIDKERKRVRAEKALQNPYPSLFYTNSNLNDETIDMGL